MRRRRPRARAAARPPIALPTAALVLAALWLGLAGAAGGTTKPSCRTGVVVGIGARHGCLRTSTLGGGHAATSLEQERAQGISALTDAAALHRLLGRGAQPIPAVLTRRVRALLTTLVAHQAAATAARVRRGGAVARAADAGGTVTDPPVYVPAGPDETGAGTITSTAHQTTTSNGVPVRIDATTSATSLADQCPDERGEIHGTFADTLTFKGTVGPMGTTRLRTVVTTTKSTTAKITAHVGPNAKIKDYDAVVDITMRSTRQTLGPAGLEHFGTDRSTDHVRFALTGLTLNGHLSDGYTPQHLGSLSIARNGSPALATVKDGQVVVHHDFASLVTDAIDLVQLGAREPLGEAEKVFSSGKCLTASFAPGQLHFAAGATDADPVTVTITDRKGHPVDLLLHASGGSKITPGDAQTGAAGTATFVVSTDSQSDGSSLHVEGVSNRGTVSGEITGSKPQALAYGYHVELSGTGSYHEDDTHSDAWTSTVEHYDTPDIRFTAQWPDTMPVILRLDGGPVNPYGTGAMHATMTGTTTSSGSHAEDQNNASFTCSGPLLDQESGANSIAVVQSAAGTSLTIDLYANLTADPDHNLCSTTGNWYGTQRGNSVGRGTPSDVLGGPKATVPVSFDLLRKPTFTLQLAPDSIAPCVGYASMSCSSSATFSATITFTRIETCTPTSSSGYSCTRP